MHVFSICDARSEVARFLEIQIENVRLNREWLISKGLQTRKALKAIHDEYIYWIDKLHKRFKVRETVVENITVTVGRAVLAQRLGGDNTFTGNISHTALGTDNTAPVVGDTTLGTETFRKALSSGTDLNNVAFIETFFTAAEVTGTFEEYGNFIDGSGDTDSGQLFNRFLTTITKSATETMNVQSVITFDDA